MTQPTRNQQQASEDNATHWYYGDKGLRKLAKVGYRTLREEIKFWEQPGAFVLMGIWAALLLAKTWLGQLLKGAYKKA